MSLIPRDQLFDLDRLFGDRSSFSPTRFRTADVFMPSVDIREKDDAYVIQAELPGVNKDDLHVTLDKGTLTIDARLNDESSEEEDGKVIRRERRFGQFTRSFQVGEGIAESDITASFKDGVLNLTLPRRQPVEPEKRRITVN